MKSIELFLNMTAKERETNLKSRVKKDDEVKKEIVKILVAAEEKGDFGKGEMNSYAQRVTGYELRREVQGVYEHCNVFRAIRSKEIAMTETDFDKAGKAGLIKLLSCLSSRKELVAEAVEIIKSGKEVTNRLAELMKKKAEPKSKDSAESGAGESSGPEVPEIQTPDAPEGTSFFVPKGTAILATPALVSAILAEIKGTKTGDECQAYFDLFKDLTSHVMSRWEVIEAEAQTPAELAAA